VLTNFYAFPHAFKSSQQLNCNIYPPHCVPISLHAAFFGASSEQSPERTSVSASNKCLVGGNLFEFDWASPAETTMFSQQQYPQFYFWRFELNLSPRSSKF
jgi:hypothetical protein